MMAAGVSAEKGHRVAIVERNKVFGRKLLLTGKGRCNLTNHTDIENHVNNLFPQGKFLYSALNLFPPAAMMKWFEERGVNLKVERGQRVFPANDDSHSIRDAMVEYMKNNGVELKPLQKVLECQVNENGFLINTDKEKIRTEKLILATGGCSYPQTGSQGDGYGWAEKFGHKIEKLEPGLVPLISKKRILNEARGLLLKNVKIRLKDRKENRLYEELGELEIIENGFSGALALSASLFVKKGENFFLGIDLKPGLDHKKLDLRLQRDLEERSNESLEKIMGGLLPAKMISPFEKITGLDFKKSGHEISREERKKIGENLKKISFLIEGKKDWDEAIITMGGINCEEIIPKTMESKIIPGLFFAGEIINVHGLTGGYNLQAAFSTGFLAGSNC